MRRSASGVAACALLALLSLGASCEAASEDVPHFRPLDVSGTWDVYRTYEGEPERGPDAASWSSSPDGWGVRMELLCSTRVLPEGHMAIAGEIAGTKVTLESATATWEGTVAGSTMTGTFSDTNGSGSWRAEKVAIARCRTYEVWGGTTDLGCGGGAGYEPQDHGYLLLGTATATYTFAGEYPWYYVVTRDRHVVLVDTVETTAGAYLGTESTGNVVGTYTAIGGAPDGGACAVGTGALSQGGFVRLAPATAPPSITVHVLPE